MQLLLPCRQVPVGSTHLECYAEILLPEPRNEHATVATTKSDNGTLSTATPSQAEHGEAKR